MEKFFSTFLLGVAMSLFTLQVSANEIALRSGSVEVIALSGEQAERLQEERLVFKAFINRTMALDNQTSRESLLENIRLEYKSRMDTIVNDSDSSNDSIRHHRPTRVIY